MASSFRKEIVWLCLPVTLIALVATLRQSGSGTLLPDLHIENPLAPGPVRLEFSSFSPKTIEPYDAYKGFDWKAQTMVRSRGTRDIPKNWVQNGIVNMGQIGQLRLVYRRGKIWKQAKPNNPNNQLFSFRVEADNQRTFLVNLKTLPRDAEEVRLRGYFEEMELYRGALPTGWKPRKDLRTAGLNQFLTIRSKPFDVQIKGQNEPMPAPTVDKEPQLEVVDGKWLTNIALSIEDWRRDVFVLQLRRKDGAYISDPKTVWSQNLQLFDANGKKLDLYDDRGKKREIEFWPSHGIKFHPKNATSDYFAVFLSNQIQPNGGWMNATPPLRLRGEIGIEGSWPQKIDVEVAHLLMTPQEFGATK